MKKAVFLDRDNTLIHDDGYISEADKVRLLPGVKEGLRLLQNQGFELVIVTNQSGIGRGIFTEADMHSVNDRLQELLGEDINFAGIYFCPHRPDENSDCRKPAPGMFLKARDELGIDFSQSFMVGDRKSDVMSGETIGLRGILLGTDDGQEKPACHIFTAEDFSEAVNFILETSFNDAWQQKIIASADKSSIKERTAGKKLVFTNGCFDILHPGHLQYLTQARALGDALVIAINDDDSVRRLKGESRPVNGLADRMLMLANLDFVDYVTSFSEQTPIETIKAIKPDIHVKGGDYVAEELPEYGAVTEGGGEVFILPFRQGYSSSKIIKTINQQG